jgi:DNA invertase Pin-like site-specific DNA recombinase
MSSEAVFSLDPGEQRLLRCIADQWRRQDLIGTVQELYTVGVGFVSLTEALDMTSPGGRALAGMLAGIAQARKEGRPHGRPPPIQQHATEIATLFAGGVSKRQIATRCILRLIVITVSTAS